MKVIVKYNKRRYLIDYLKFLVYNSFDLKLKSIFILTFITYILKSLNKSDMIYLYPKIVNLLWLFLVYLLIGYFVCFIIQISIKTYRFSKTLNLPIDNKLVFNFNTKEIEIYYNETMLKSINWNFISSVQYIYSTIYLIPVNKREIVIQINKKDVISNNFYGIIENIRDKWN